MRSIMKNYLLAIACLMLVAGCSANTNKPAAAIENTDTYPIPKDKIVKDVEGVKGGKLILSLSGNLDTFNVLLTNTADTQTALGGYVFQGLSDLDPVTMQDIPLLAKSFETSPDGLTYTYTLRDGVLWSDGQPFTMDDVIFSFELVYDASLAIGEREILQNPDGTLPEITRLNDKQIQFKIKSLNVLFNGSVGSVKILPKHIWGEVFKEGKFAQAMLLSENPAKIVGTGPFVIDSYTADQRLVLKRNPYYYAFDKKGNRLPYLDKVIRVIVPDFQAEVIKFQNGETDMLEIKKPEDVDLLKRDEVKGGYTVHSVGAGFNSTYLTFNQNNRANKDGKPFVEAKKLKLFSDKRFKQAISYAIDRASIIKTVLNEQATPLYAFTSPANAMWYNPNQKKYPFDLAKAKELLNEIGLKDSNNDGKLEYEDGTPISFNIKTNAENQMRIQAANLIKNDFAKLGFEVSLNPIPMNSVSDNLNKNYDYDAVLLGWGTAIPPDPVMSKSVMLSQGQSHNWNPMQTTPQTEWEKRIDELMMKNQSTLDKNERIKIWFEVLEIWGEELPQIMMYSPNVNVAIHNNFGNVKPIAIRPYFDYNVDEIFDKNLLNQK